MFKKTISIIVLSLLIFTMFSTVKVEASSSIDEGSIVFYEEYGVALSDLDLSYDDLDKIELFKFNGYVRKSENEVRNEIISIGIANRKAKETILSLSLVNNPIGTSGIVPFTVDDGGAGGGTVDCSLYSLVGTSILLTDAEKALVLDHPFKAIEVNVAKGRAEDYTTEYFGAVAHHNDKGDAYRHAIWNGLMVKAIGYSYAYDFATAHEDKPDGCNPEIEKTMDLYNNMKGRVITNAQGTYTTTNIWGQTVTKFYSRDFIAQLLFDELENGEMKYIKNGILVYTDE